MKIFRSYSFFSEGMVPKFFFKFRWSSNILQWRLFLETTEFATDNINDQGSNEGSGCNGG